MIYLISKILVTAFLIVIISEIAKTNERMGGLVAALPITTIMILFWLYYEKTPTEKISNHMSFTFLYVLPTLPMFLTFPYLINKFGFYISVILSIIMTIFFIFIVDFISKKFGYKIIWWVCIIFIIILKLNNLNKYKIMSCLKNINYCLQVLMLTFKMQ